MPKMSEIISYIWEDREIKFDVPNLQHKLRGGEKILDAIDSIEDTKGTPDDRGRILITNLRIIWYSLTTAKFNLSIGFSCILTITTKAVLNKQRGTTQALYILTVHDTSRFEFIFTNLQQNNPHVFQSIYEIHRSYQQSYLYRELKLRSVILTSGQLNVLPHEQVYSTLNGVWNLSSDQGNLGTLVITNVRIIWYADVNDIFNISLPFMQILSVRVRESKYGPALVLTTLDTAGGYILGFRIDPPERLGDIYKELISLHTIYGENPIFGVSYDPKNKERFRHVHENTLKIDEIEEIDEKTSNEINVKYSQYLTEFNQEPNREPFYCKQLGFSMEKIKDGYTLKDLWEVIT